MLERFGEFFDDAAGAGVDDAGLTCVLFGVVDEPGAAFRHAGEGDDLEGEVGAIDGGDDLAG